PLRPTVPIRHRDPKPPGRDRKTAPKPTRTGEIDVDMTRKAARVAKPVHTRQPAAGRAPERRPGAEPVARPSSMVETAHACTRPAQHAATDLRPLPPSVALPLLGLLGRPAR